MSHSTTTCTISVYLLSKTTLLAKICAIEVLIDTMVLRLTEAAAGQNAVIDEYSMDDGQMKVKTSYRSTDELVAGIYALERLKEIHINNFNGRGVVLRDVRGINRY